MSDKAMTAPVSLTPERVNELIDILDDRYCQLQPRDCSHLIHALIELRSLRTELLAARREWVPVSERLPEDGWYWTYSKVPPHSHPQGPTKIHRGIWWTSFDVTHWKHLPPPPETAV